VALGTSTFTALRGAAADACRARSVLDLAIILLVAFYSLCGLVLAENAQAVPNYKELIYSAVKSSFLDASSVGLLEISPLHPTRPPQLGDWMACLRISVNSQPMLYAAFIEGQPPRVLLLRMAVRFDDCGQDQYEPFSGSPPAETRPQGPLRKR
jgi:hypothetical protein